MTGDGHEMVDQTVDLGFARVDTGRAARTGDPEVVYGAGKTPEQVVEIVSSLRAARPHSAVLATRLSQESLDAVVASHPDAVTDPVARAVTVAPLPVAQGLV